MLTDLEAAAQYTLKVIRCLCEMDCSGTFANAKKFLPCNYAQAFPNSVK